nr:MAG TPA: hypothetical protein [Caudoviricetes sp.]
MLCQKPPCNLAWVASRISNIPSRYCMCRHLEQFTPAAFLFPPDPLSFFVQKLCDFVIENLKITET